MLITSKDNETIKHIRKLKEKKYRDEFGEYLIEGVKLINEAIQENCNIKTIVICDNCNKEAINQNIMYEIAKLECIYVDEKVFNTITEVKNPQGILAVIEKNSRIDIHELAILLGEDEVAVANAIADMEKENIICGYHTLINWDNTSQEKVIALIEVRVTPQRDMGFDKIAERIYNYSEVSACYLMSGAYDFTVILLEKTMKEVAQFVSSKLSTIDAVLSTATHFVLKKYKDYGTVLVSKENKDERMLVTP